MKFTLFIVAFICASFLSVEATPGKRKKGRRQSSNAGSSSSSASTSSSKDTHNQQQSTTTSTSRDVPNQQAGLPGQQGIASNRDIQNQQPGYPGGNFQGGGGPVFIAEQPSLGREIAVNVAGAAVGGLVGGVTGGATSALIHQAFNSHDKKEEQKSEPAVTPTNGTAAPAIVILPASNTTINSTISVSANSQGSLNVTQNNNSSGSITDIASKIKSSTIPEPSFPFNFGPAPVSSSDISRKELCLERAKEDCEKFGECDIKHCFKIE